MLNHVMLCYIIFLLYDKSYDLSSDDLSSDDL